VEIQNDQNLDKFFSVIRSKLEVKDELMAAQESQLAPDFNALEVLCPDENRLSSVIGMLLDPVGEHGQKDVFVRLFLEKIGVNLPAKNDSRAIRGLEVVTNLIENNQRRIDILIDFGDFGLGIENKPWAGDQNGQLIDYERYLSRRYSNGDYVLIYLSGNGSDPSEFSTNAEQRRQIKERDGKIKVVSYETLGEWVVACMEKCRSARVRYFLEDFKTYIGKKFSGGSDVVEKKLIVTEATKAENIRSCFLITSFWPDIAKELMHNLMKLTFQQVFAKLENQGEDWESTDFNFSLHEKYTGFGFKKKQWEKYFFKFEFDGRNASNLAYGVFKINKQDQALENMRNHLIEQFGGNHSPVWPWYCDLDNPYRNWGESDEPWNGIYPNGRTVEVISKKLSLLVNEATSFIDAAERG